MARPRVFVSSTYYDLKHIRSSLEIFIDSLGFEAVLSEAGDIAYLPDVALDESCYREAASADIFVLIVGGRYGSEVSGSDSEIKDSTNDRYESITKTEFETAHKQDIPIYVLIDSSVHKEYLTYLRNRDNATVEYAHVDSINVFRFIDFVFGKQRNNPVFDFDRASDIEDWLRDQWAGLFREMLRSRSQQKQITTLTEQVSEMKAINNTLKSYMEAVLVKVTPDTSSKLIKDEKEKFAESVSRSKFETNPLVKYIHNAHKIDFETIEKSISNGSNIEKFLNTMKGEGVNDATIERLVRLMESSRILADYNECRIALGKRPIKNVDD